MWFPATIRSNRVRSERPVGGRLKTRGSARRAPPDLRHTYASLGAGGGLGLPIIGRLLGHAQTATTARYAHLDNDPLRRASEAIARFALPLRWKEASKQTSC